MTNILCIMFNIDLTNYIYMYINCTRQYLTNYTLCEHIYFRTRHTFMSIKLPLNV